MLTCLQTKIGNYILDACARRLGIVLRLVAVVFLISLLYGDAPAPWAPFPASLSDNAYRVEDFNLVRIRWSLAFFPSSIDKQVELLRNEYLVKHHRGLNL